MTEHRDDTKLPRSSLPSRQTYPSNLLDGLIPSASTCTRSRTLASILPSHIDIPPSLGDTHGYYGSLPTLKRLIYIREVDLESELLNATTSVTSTLVPVGRNMDPVILRMSTVRVCSWYKVADR